jgi:hypothetical protein
VGRSVASLVIDARADHEHFVAWVREGSREPIGRLPSSNLVALEENALLVRPEPPTCGSFRGTPYENAVTRSGDGSSIVDREVAGFSVEQRDARGIDEIQETSLVVWREQAAGCRP